ncbi:MAG: hypothetical protein K940chlam9_00748 [Chlamydiae bacterium]|nr:hypothetical protein [Chlamydiota bacterium]
MDSQILGKKIKQLRKEIFMDLQILGKKIKLLRKKSGLTQDEVEKAVALPQKALTHIESGARKVSTLELAKLSKLFHVPIAGFFFQEMQEEDVLVALHRIAPGLESDPKIHDQVAKYVQVCREGAFLKDVLGISRQKSIRTYSSPIPKNVQEAQRQGEEVAREERRSFELGDAPIYDIADLLSSQGIWTAQTLLPNEMSGLFLHHSSLGMAIIINAAHVYVRQCFSYAHEYAHALFDANHTVSISNAENAKDLIEVRANAFASAFLMPEQGIASLLRSMGKGEGGRRESVIYDVSTERAIENQHRQVARFQKITAQTVAWITYHFGVSYQATVYRLQNLGYFNAKARIALLKDEFKGREFLRILSLQDKEPPNKQAYQNRELKAQVAALAIEAFQREDISRGRLLDLSELLELPGNELLKFAEGEKAM